MDTSLSPKKISFYIYCKVSLHSADNIRPFCCTKPAKSGHFKGFFRSKSLAENPLTLFSSVVWLFRINVSRHCAMNSVWSRTVLLCCKRLNNVKCIWNNSYIWTAVVDQSEEEAWKNQGFNGLRWSFFTLIYNRIENDTVSKSLHGTYHTVKSNRLCQDDLVLRPLPFVNWIWEWVKSTYPCLSFWWTVLIHHTTCKNCLCPF